MGAYLAGHSLGLASALALTGLALPLGGYVLAFWLLSLGQLVGAGFAWVALNASDASTTAVVLALLVAGIGISMALPTVPTAVLSAVAPSEMGKASGVNSTLQRFGAVFAIAIVSSVFEAYGDLGSPAAFSDGFAPALGACAAFSLLGTLAALVIAPKPQAVADVEGTEIPAAV